MIVLGVLVTLTPAVYNSVKSVVCPAAKALMAALKDPEVGVRQQALYALQNQGGNLKSILPAVVPTSTSRDRAV